MFNAWTLVHVLFPLLPFGLGGILRLVSSLKLSWNTFSAPDLAICLGLLALLVSQSLAKMESQSIPNDDPTPEARAIKEDRADEVRRQIHVFLACAITLIVLFAATTIFESIVHDRGDNDFKISLRICQSVTYVSLMFILWLTRRTQQGFRLRGGLW